MQWEIKKGVVTDNHGEIVLFRDESPAMDSPL